MTFNEFALANEAAIRLAAFFGIFAVMALWEVAAPRRNRLHTRARRWSANLGLVVFNTVLVRLVFPFAAVAFATLAAQRGWGLLNNVTLPEPLALVLAVVAMDFAIWLQHVMVHAVPVLWRLHQVHHADPDYDVTTGARFHPLEIILSMLIKFSVIAVLGAPAAAVMVFEVLLNATAMFNHGNVKLPAGVDAPLRLLLVTPDMHRVHHSTDNAEANSNFGFNLSVWDRLFGTYRPAARLPQESMQIGVAGLTGDPRCVSLGGMLVIPFVNPGEGYAIGHEAR
ncbi:MAG: sterol desaturase family protein [Sulfuritalea sp.]|nr:sterol desaturase family protein [Sulfuritalea sp.]MDP1982583.1 sterol desaturase family protein [Sulfuritalea sp.]